MAPVAELQKGQGTFAAHCTEDDGAPFTSCFTIIYGLYVRNSVNTSYQSAHCLIVSKTINYISETSNTHQNMHYAPLLTYTLATCDGQQIAGQGYDGPMQSEFWFVDEAQRILDKYQEGHTYACWYSRAAFRNQAVLALNPYDRRSLL
jgi:hypothetical protein